jgi:hypothetical protein
VSLDCACHAEEHFRLHALSIKFDKVAGVKYEIVERNH